MELDRANQKERLVHCRYNPVEPGQYTINVLWSNAHVEGSPYAIDVFKPKKLEYPVTVYGPGIHDGILPNFESHFIVDARGAGAGELKVVLFGPKGYFIQLQNLERWMDYH